MMDLYQRKKTDSPTQNQEIQSKKRGKIKEKSEEKFFTKKSLDIFFLIHVCHLEYQSRISNLFSFFQSDFKQKRLDLKWHKGHLYNRCEHLCTGDGGGETKEGREDEEGEEREAANQPGGRLQGVQHRGDQGQHRQVSGHCQTEVSISSCIYYHFSF